MKFNRRRVLQGASGALIAGGIAGCTDLLGEDDEDDPASGTVYLLAEGSDDIDHACGHADDQPLSLEGGPSAEEATHFDQTHTLYELEIEDGSVFVEYEDHGHDHGNGDDEYDGGDAEDRSFDDLGVDDFVLLDRGHDPHEEIADIHDDHWHGDPLEVHEGETLSLGADITGDDGESIELDGDSGSGLDLEVAVAEGAHEDVVHTHGHGDHVHIDGDHEGSTEVEFEIYDNDAEETVYRTPPIETVVGHDDHHDHDGDHAYFFTSGGHVEVHDGHEMLRAEIPDDRCDGFDEYVEVELHDGHSVLEVIPE